MINLIKRKIVAIAIKDFLVVFIVVSPILSYYQKDLDLVALRGNLFGIRNHLNIFIDQDWSISSLSSKTSGRVIKELSKSLDDKVACVWFYHKRNIVGTIGNCLTLDPPTEKGWSTRDSFIFLNENYRHNVSAIFAFENEDNAIVTNKQTFELPISFNHIASALSIALSISFLYVLMAFTFRKFKSLSIFNEQAKDKLHDYNSQCSDDLELSEDIEEYCDEPSKIIQISRILKNRSIYREALLYSENAVITSHDLYSIIEILQDGLTREFNPSVFQMNIPNRNINLKTDRKIVLRILHNLLINSVRYSAKNRYCSNLSINIHNKKVQFEVKNPGKIDNPNIIFKKGISFSKSSGRGLAIVASLAKKIDSDIIFTNNQNTISFSFEVPYLLENS